MRRAKEKVMAENQAEDRSADIEMTAEEFQRSVQVEVKRQLAEVMTRLSISEASSPASERDPEDMDVKGLIRMMAMGIAEVGDQGSGRKRVPPAVLAERRGAKERMTASIEKFSSIVLAAQAREDRRVVELNYPHYRVVGKMYLGDRLLEPYTVDPVTKLPRSNAVFWLGAPNPNLVPLNAPAHEIHRHFCDWVGLTHEGRKEKPLWISAGGLVIAGESAPAHRLAIPEGGGGPAMQPEFGDALMGRREKKGFNSDDITKPRINVLGTIATPATQSGGHAVKSAGSTEF